MQQSKEQWIKLFKFYCVMRIQRSAPFPSRVRRVTSLNWAVGEHQSPKLLPPREFDINAWYLTFKVPWIVLNYIFCFICTTQMRGGQTLSSRWHRFWQTSAGDSKLKNWWRHLTINVELRHWSLDGATIGMNKMNFKMYRPTQHGNRL